MAQKGIFAVNPVGPVNGFQKTINCPHSEIDGKNQPKKQKGSVSDFRYMCEVGIHDLHNVCRDKPFEAFFR